MKVAISAGHNPVAQGAAFAGRTEYIAALDWCAALKPALEEFGFDVFVVPTGSLSAKIGAINAEKCDAAMELHFNADGAHRGVGSETLYMPGSQEGERFARSVQAPLGQLCSPSRGVKEAWYRMDRPGHSDYPGDKEGDEVVDAFVRLTHCPAIIVEPCFIHEAAVFALRVPACKEIARGAAEYLFS